MSIIFNSAGIAETMNNGVANVTGADSIITENYTNVIQHGITIDISVREKTLSGTPPLPFNSNGTPLIDCTIYGNAVQAGTPTYTNPIQPQGCGDLETVGEKAGQFKIPISSANTTTPVYLGEVQTVRKIIKYEFTGEENWVRESGNTYALEGVKQTATGYENALCTHYVLAKSYNTLTGTDGTFSVSRRPALFIHDDNFATPAQLKTYLATQYANGTPVVIYYTLNTPQTAVVNEPLRKIGDYADTLSMEQAGVTIPTAVGNNIIDVQTTLKPSNISITYKGR